MKGDVTVLGKPRPESVVTLARIRGATQDLLEELERADSVSKRRCAKILLPWLEITVSDYPDEAFWRHLDKLTEELKNELARRNFTNAAAIAGDLASIAADLAKADEKYRLETASIEVDL